MGNAQHWDDPERVTQRQQAMRDPNPQSSQLRRAVFAREIGSSQRLSGSHVEHANTRHFNLPQFAPVQRRDAAGRVEVVDWSRHRQPDA